MTVQGIIELTGAKLVTTGADLEREAGSGCSCDLLSWVMSHGCEGMVWVTVQTHMNVIAVAALLDFACVILPDGVQMPSAVLDKANDEGIAVLQSDKTAFELCGLMYGKGMPGAVKK